MVNETRLTDLIGSRICHDLVSPLSAIGTGVELLSISNAGASPELSLISESIANANARIRFFRVAFGAASSEAMIGNTELRSILLDTYRGSRVRIDWCIECDLLRQEAKLAFLLLQCIESSLPWGGVICVSRDESGRWRMVATGERLKVESALWDMVANSQSEVQINASIVQFALVQPIAAQMRRAVETRFETSRITISF